MLTWKEISGNHTPPILLTSRKIPINALVVFAILSLSIRVVPLPIRHKYCGHVRPDGKDDAAYSRAEHSIEDDILGDCSSTLVNRK